MSLNLPGTTNRVDLIRNQPRVKVLGYYDEEEIAHIPETQRSTVDYLIQSAQPIPVEDLVYDKGNLLSVQILDPRTSYVGYKPVILHVADFKMEVYV